MSPNAEEFMEGILKCEESIKKVLLGKKCFEDLNKFILADKIAKHEFTIKKDKVITSRKSVVLGKFKTYAARKEEKRMKLANVGTRKRKVVDPLKQDKEFLKKLVSEFSCKDSVTFR